MVDPAVRLALALHTNRGAYAALVGSGISAAAGIPTGWQIVADLITRVATLEGATIDGDPIAWYRGRYGEEPDYSKLLDEQRDPPTERSLLLRRYFEPTEDERRRGLRVPGAAHRALAQLAVKGYISVFLTTNFDRLLEQAIEAAGIVPTTLSTPDSIEGSAPFSHNRITVVKLNGDYLDTRIKNTPEELDFYHPSIDALLDRVLDEYGLIVCGWSGDWDTALRRAFERSPSHRYTTFWASRSAPGGQAARLIELRRGEHVPIKDADTLFTDLVTKVAALETELKPAPAAPADTGGHGDRLPMPLSSFVGRREEMAEIGALLESSRLVTLTGAGGAGKTRLALQVGAEYRSRFPDGVGFVSLAPVSDPLLVSPAIAAALGTSEERLTDFLRDKTMLLILDNCEHLLDACAGLAESVLAGADRVRIMATSREALRVPGEMVFRVPSLSVPDPAQSLSVDALLSLEAVRLFVDRAKAVQPGFAVTDRNGAAIAQIVRRFDGIPLAIELAAARVRVLSPQQIADRLDESFRLLTGGSRSALPRQQTMRATIEWSYELLSEAEKLLLNRLSVFRGGFSLEAAERVGAGTGVPGIDVLDLLTDLTDKSMVVVEQGLEGAAHYRLLETVRQYGAERLAEAGEAGETRQRHAGFFLETARIADPALHSAEQVEWLVQLERDHDNYREALAWSLETGHVDDAIWMATSLCWFWWIHHHFGEGYLWLERALAASADASPRARAAALGYAAMFETARLGDFGRAYGRLQESLKLFVELEDKPGVLNNQWITLCAAWFARDLTRASAVIEEAMPLLVQAGYVSMVTWFEWFRGSIARLQGDRSAAAASFERSLAAGRELGERLVWSFSLNQLAGMAGEEGDYDHASRLYDESLPLFQQVGDPAGTASVLIGQGLIAWLQGDRERALLLYRQSHGHFKLSDDNSWTLASMPVDTGSLANLKPAKRRHEERLRLSEELWANVTLADGLRHFGRMAGRRGDLEQAKILLADSLSLSETSDDRPGIAQSLLAMAVIARAEGNLEQAGQLIQQAEASAAGLSPDARADYEAAAEEDRALLAERPTE